MEHEVHQREAAGILHMLHAEERASMELALLGFGPGRHQVTRIIKGKRRQAAYEVARHDGKSTRAGCWVLDDVFERGLHHPNHTLNEWPWGEVLARSTLFLIGILLEKPFVEIAEAFLPCAVPVELIDLGH